MADISNKAEEAVGSAKQVAGDLTGNDSLHAEGTADKARAKVEHGVDVVTDQAKDVAESVADKAEDVQKTVSDTAEKAAEKLSDFADSTGQTNARVVAAISAAGILLVTALLVRRARPKRRAKAAAKSAVAAGVGRLVTG
ncbi:CsbD family protein [Mycolicibacterium sp. 050158]|uniref:CsbD family protein n=1 Tax=Mycolicibacterium sp. 050158 TaxID=3090602 RepID=UPI00299DCD77|nr:CsbD family protein [Mycolicibacterium sp. 050158]MDX1890702.1 CsbD family protein [Mycolicibacterium sp. 050158]